MRQGLTKSDVIEAAAEIANSQGFEQATLASVAQKLGIRTPSLYNHIDGLQGLRKELALYSIQKLKNVIVEAAIGKSGKEAFLSIGTSYVLFAEANPGLYEATMRAPDPLDAEIDHASDEIISLLFRLLEPFHLDPEHAVHAVRGLRSIVHGFVSLDINKGFNLKIDSQESLNFILNKYMDGLIMENGSCRK